MISYVTVINCHIAGLGVTLVTVNKSHNHVS